MRTVSHCGGRVPRHKASGEPEGVSRRRRLALVSPMNNCPGLTSEPATTEVALGSGSRDPMSKARGLK
ncbi:MAG: hypothetical protein QNJ51_00405 [Calothrix sp. MO_167.B12]|nr:hypothetical protein [Calothrix sp. MO_167.B12]